MHLALLRVKVVQIGYYTQKYKQKCKDYIRDVIYREACKIYNEAVIQAIIETIVQKEEIYCDCCMFCVYY